MADRFTFYKSFADALEFIPPEEHMNCLTALFSYVFDGEDTAESNSAKLYMTLIKPVLDTNKKRQDGGQKGAEHGKKGGRPKKNVETEGVKQENPIGVIDKNPLENPIGVFEKTPDKEIDIDKDNKEKVLPKGNTKKKFVKPTVEEVRAYCLERKNNIDPERFVDYYESNGWKVGKNPMKDWKACVRSWEKNSDQRKTERPAAPKNRFNNFENSQKYDIGSIEQAMLQRARDG